MSASVSPDATCRERVKATIPSGNDYSIVYNSDIIFKTVG